MPQLFGIVRYEESGQERMAVYCPTKLIYNEALKRGEQWVEDAPGMDRGVKTRIQSKHVGLVGFPSTFAGFKYLDRFAAGPVSWKLNGDPYTQHYDPAFTDPRESR